METLGQGLSDIHEFAITVQTWEFAATSEDNTHRGGEVPTIVVQQIALLRGIMIEMSGPAYERIRNRSSRQLVIT